MGPSLIGLNEAGTAGGRAPGLLQTWAKVPLHQDRDTYIRENRLLVAAPLHFIESWTKVHWTGLKVFIIMQRCVKVRKSMKKVCQKIDKRVLKYEEKNMQNYAKVCKSMQKCAKEKFSETV